MICLYLWAVMTMTLRAEWQGAKSKEGNISMGGQECKASKGLRRRFPRKWDGRKRSFSMLATCSDLKRDNDLK